MKTTVTPLPQPQLFESLLEARERLEIGKVGGMLCPCCGQYAKIYNRKLNSAMAYGLILVDKYFRGKYADEWLHIEKFLVGRTRATDFYKLVGWDLIEHKPALVNEKYSGYWKITQLGKDFVSNAIRVPAKIQFWNNQAIDKSDKTTSIIESLGEKFNYFELMSATL